MVFNIQEIKAKDFSESDIKGFVNNDVDENDEFGFVCDNNSKYNKLFKYSDLIYKKGSDKYGYMR